VATSEEKTGGEESDFDSDSGFKVVTRREKILFAMSMVRTLCALLSGLASALVLYKILQMAHR
jgi:hypothetical protein